MLHPCLGGPMVNTRWQCPVRLLPERGLWMCPKIQFEIRTAPISGGCLISSNMSSFSRFLSLRTCGSLAAWGTENLSLSGEGCYFYNLGCFGLFLPPGMEDGRHLCPDLWRRFHVVDSPAVFVIYLFPILVVRNKFLYFWVNWSEVFVHE